MSMKSILLFASAALLLGASPAPAFLPPTDRNGPLTVTIADPGEVQALEKALAVPVTLSNSSAQPLAGKLRIAVTDEWRVEGQAVRDFVVPANGKLVVPASVIAGRGTYAALYPVHAYADFTVSGAPPATAHAILIASIAPAAVAAQQMPVFRQQLDVPARGALQLDKLDMFRITIAIHGREPVVQTQSWQGHDAATGGSFAPTEANRGDLRRAFNVHPPYRGGWGQVWADCKLQLPAAAPITLEFATAIRDVDPKREPPSDGVQFEVQVKSGNGFTNLFTRFSKATQWEAARVDLTAFAGREVTLRFVTDPGPAHNTTCDGSFWSSPVLFCGPPPAVEAAAAQQGRRALAVANARAALAGNAPDWAWKLESCAGLHGAALVPGPYGISDACLAFSDGQRDLVFEGFAVQVNQLPLGPPRHSALCEQVGTRFRWGRRGVLDHDVFVLGQRVGVRTEVWAESGALRFAFSMPDAKRDARGTPRFTLLGLGAASELATRVYAGFGNVLEKPGRFELHANGFQLATSHVGVDFAGGLSLVQASDVFPDLFAVNPEKQLYQLRTHHDATLSLVPSAHGAFAAARAYRAIAGFKPAGGVAKLQGKMCLDQWGGDYAAAARGLDRAARYGVTDAVFVKHDWQRWGYDYRLPDIYPPRGSLADFLAMADACKRNGILFAPHDNYIDFYPDADGYSYEHIIFNSDGTPQKAWFNKGRDALSYRWLPNAFAPWLERNLKLITDQIEPTSYFVDVFSAMAPVDYYDRAGRFHTKTECADLWGACFDTIRKAFGDHAPMISEAGHDALIGHLDGGESDHSGWMPAGESYFGWHLPAADAERVPWHDMASHGSFVLLAGGLGSRYAGRDWGAPAVHNYASDDYLTTTVLGGRNPMCEGPFSRNAVMTYWLLHDLCAELAQREILAHEFGASIHQQRVTFAGDAAVAVNRGMDDWKADGVILPRYGFVAQAGAASADITLRDGQVSAMARKGQLLFVDARPMNAHDSAYVGVKVAGLDDLGGGRGRLRLDWEVLQAVPEAYHLFIHFTLPSRQKDEGIVFQGTSKIPAAHWRQPGKFSSEVEFTMPQDLKLPDGLGIRIGFYAPKQQGARLRLAGNMDNGGRVRCGAIRQAKGGGALTWSADPAEEDILLLQQRQNLSGKALDFGPVITAGAFRLDATKPSEWVLTPLPDSLPFGVEIKLDQLAAAGAKVTRVQPQDETGKELDAARFEQAGDRLRFQTAADVFAYRISLGK
jgi:hypothetical protein